MNDWFCIGVPVGIAAGGWISRNNTTIKQALFITESIVISSVITHGTKKLISRKRPAENDPTLIPVLDLSHGSFPSGHTSIAFSMATALTIICPKWYIWIPAFSYATLIAYSRLYLGVHYPTDLISGALLGSGSAWLSYRLNKWMHKEKKSLKNRAY